MLPSWNILQAILHCHYKAWQLARSEEEQIDIGQEHLISTENAITLPLNFLTPIDRLIIAALLQGQSHATNQSQQSVKIIFGGQNSPKQSSTVLIRLDSMKAQKLYVDARDIINKNDPPPFYRNTHCPECQFRDVCYKKLKERDCISLLSSMSPKVIAKFHKKGIYSITQLSHLFRPRRRRRHPQVSSNYLWELKALAITEQKTFVLSPPGIKDTPVSIYMDFEGVPDEGWIYLIGILIIEQGKQDRTLSFWADAKENEKEIFVRLFDLLKQYPEAAIYHYGSYETKVLKQIQKKWSTSFKNEMAIAEQQMVNLLGFLRTHVYPPIYSNGLKELARFLGFQWSVDGADGLLSIHWRKKWEDSNETTWKDKLIQYNQDDCKALAMAKKWLYLLATNAENENVQQVAEMKKQSIFKFQNNPELGTDFQFISKAAYFDYQRTKIYWRNKKILSIAATSNPKPKASKKGTVVWQPKKVNEVIVLAPLSQCPRCGTTKVYQYKR
jgi:predicted RecB family nuclease